METRDRYLDLPTEQKITKELESEDDDNCNRCSWYGHKRIGTRTGGLKNKRMSGDHRNYNIVEIGQYIKQSPGDSSRLAVTQTPTKNHQQILE